MLGRDVGREPRAMPRLVVDRCIENIDISIRYRYIEYIDVEEVDIEIFNISNEIEIKNSMSIFSKSRYTFQ